VLSNETFLDAEMPNAEGFIVDDRPATEYSQWSVYTNEACMTNCKDSVEITMRAAVLDVTPKETQARRIQEMVEQTNPNAPAAAVETQTAEAVPATEALAAAPAPAAGGIDVDVAAAGEKVFKKCKACH